MLNGLPLAILLLISGVAQDPVPPQKPDQDKGFTLNVNVDLVELHVSVFDQLDRPISGLTRDHFRITEDQAGQEIAVFRQEDMPVSLGLVLDNSRSIEPRKARMDAAAIAFVRKSNPQDETFIVNFDEDARLSLDFSSEVPAMEKTLAGIQPFGQTALFDAALLALDHIERGRHSKKALLLVTDGVDNVSKSTLEDVVKRAKRSFTAIYTIGLLSQFGGEKAEKDLITIAEAGGGRAYFPQNVEEVRVTAEKIARDLREQYTIGYRPSNQKHDGKWRSVRVEVTPPAGVTKLDAHYRHGYYGPEPPPR